ncbi:MAG: nucleotidyltransferase domain-containing protein [Patescibacteria group bacterium]
MNSLDKIIEKLKSNDAVDAVFITGSIGTKTNTSHSDIDLIVILKDNSKEIESIFTWFDGIFADIYFFDLENIKEIKESLFLPSQNPKIKHKMNAFLYLWLKKGDIRFDKSGELTNLKLLDKEIRVPQTQIFRSWNNTNYNSEANTRYFNSNDPLYHEALEIRLMYSVPQIVCSYLDFLGKPWEGEKKAITYLKECDTDFYNLFIKYTKATNLAERFSVYKQMTERVFSLNPKYKIWDKTEIIAKSQKEQFENNNDLVEHWQNLIA